MFIPYSEIGLYHKFSCGEWGGGGPCGGAHKKNELALILKCLEVKQS